MESAAVVFSSIKIANLELLSVTQPPALLPRYLKLFAQRLGSINEHYDHQTIEACVTCKECCPLVMCKPHKLRIDLCQDCIKSVVLRAIVEAQVSVREPHRKMLRSLESRCEVAKEPATLAAARVFLQDLDRLYAGSLRMSNLVALRAAIIDGGNGGNKFSITASSFGRAGDLGDVRADVSFSGRIAVLRSSAAGRSVTKSVVSASDFVGMLQREWRDFSFDGHCVLVQISPCVTICLLCLARKEDSMRECGGGGGGVGDKRSRNAALASAANCGVSVDALYESSLDAMHKAPLSFALFEKEDGSLRNTSSSRIEAHILGHVREDEALFWSLRVQEAFAVQQRKLAAAAAAGKKATSSARRSTSMPPPSPPALRWKILTPAVRQPAPAVAARRSSTLVDRHPSTSSTRVSSLPQSSPPPPPS